MRSLAWPTQPKYERPAMTVVFPRRVIEHLHFAMWTPKFAIRTWEKQRPHSLSSGKGNEMNRWIVVSSMAVFICLAGLGTAEEKKASKKPVPENQLKLKPLAFFLGTWELTGEVNLAGQPTTSFVFEQQFRWDLGNNFIQCTSSETKDGKTELRHRAMIGWDAKTQQITCWGFWNPGAESKLSPWAETVTWTQDGKTWKIEKEGVNGLYTIVDKDTHQYECTFKGDDGSSNSWHFTAKRKKMDASVSPVYQHLKDLEDFIGTWVSEDALPDDLPGIGKKGEIVTCRATNTWIQNKAMMQWDFAVTPTGGTTVLARYLFGWDPVENKISYTGFAGNGERTWGTLKKEGNDTWLWENKWCTADGKQGTGKDTTKLLDNNSVHAHSYTEAVTDGKPEPDRKLLLKRIK